MDLHIKVWHWDDAPENLKASSCHGGDEDWVALVPKELARFDIPWLESGTSFGRCDTSEHLLEDGSKVFIGAHA